MYIMPCASVDAAYNLNIGLIGSLPNKEGQRAHNAISGSDPSRTALVVTLLRFFASSLASHSFTRGDWLRPWWHPDVSILSGTPSLRCRPVSVRHIDDGLNADVLVS